MRTRSTSLAPALVLAIAAMLMPTGAGAAAHAGSAAGDFAAGQILVRFNGDRRQRRIALPDGIGVRPAAGALRDNPKVAWAVPNYIASASAVPNDPGFTNHAGGWRRAQWNFLGSPPGVRAMRAWSNLAAAGRPGGAGVKVAVLDTGIATGTAGPKFPLSPDFAPGQFAPGRDFVSGGTDAADRNGHGTHVAGTIAEQVDNGTSATGLAYGATLIPVRVLNRRGKGMSDTVATGIRWAADQGANVINLSLDFKPGVHRCGQIPAVCGAVAYATSKGALVVAAAGNASQRRVEFPASAPGALAVGATTDDACLASYSDYGTGLALVAPGGGASAPVPRGTGCRNAHRGREICQETFEKPAFANFALRCLHGTSQAAPHASAAAALVIASGVLGQDPDPGAVASRLESTARHIGPRLYYGAGLLDAGAATTK